MFTANQEQTALGNAATVAFMLNKATELAVAGLHSDAWKWLDASAALAVRGDVWCAVSGLHTAVQSLLIDCRMREGGLPREITHYHPAFAAQVGTLIPGAILLPVPPHPMGRCDFLLDVQGSRRPVEVKRDAFDWKARDQLRRYMAHYGADLGYAVAPRLTCRLPEDMSFVALTLPLATIETAGGTH